MRSVKYTESHYPVQADVLTLFDARSRWILLGNATRGHSLLAELRILLDSDVLVADRVSERSFVLLEMYRRRLKDTIIKTVIGEWDQHYGLRMTASPVLSSRRTNFHRSVFKAAMVVRQSVSSVQLICTSGGYEVLGHTSFISNYCTKLLFALLHIAASDCSHHQGTVIL